MKRLILVFLLLAILVTAVYAQDGDVNVDGSGGGGTGSGNAENGWNGGEDGVRVTILQGTTPVSILDYANKQMSKVQWSFKKQCKLYYKNGGNLMPYVEQYANIIPTVPLPRVISSTGASTIEAVRSYFRDSAVLENLALTSGIPYDDLTSGEYKLLLEPIAYFKFKNVWYAMTATEAALFDVQVSGDLKYWMGKLTHQNQPLAMYLERADLGIQPWTKATTGKQTNIDILNYLGVGIVSFKPNLPDPTPPDGEYQYRTNTDVITAFLTGPAPTELTPDDPGRAVFTVLGRSYVKEYVCPQGGRQLVWFRWHTPDTPQDVEISVSGDAGMGTLVANITEVPDVEPPDPIYDGPDIGGGQYQPNFRLEDPPAWGSNLYTKWSEWAAVWIPPPLPGGPGGYWRFYQNEYTAALTVSYKLVPDDRVETAFRRGDGYEIKSGYGINAECKVTVATAGGATGYDVTPVQNVVAVFPEFQYKTYDRILVPDRPGLFTATWGFKPNEYSYYLHPVHFTPLWYPDRMDFPVPLAVFDAWTPGGQLYATVKDSVYIDGSIYDDSYIRLLS